VFKNGISFDKFLGLDVIVIVGFVVVAHKDKKHNRRRDVTELKLKLEQRSFPGQLPTENLHAQANDN